MPRFRYMAVQNGTETVEGVIDAQTRAAVVDRLHALGQIPIRVEEAGSAALPAMRITLQRAGRLSPTALAALTAQLATLLNAGLALDDALSVLREAARRPAARAVLGKILDSVSGGSSVADAMAAQPSAFPPQYVSMVRAGEAGGQLHTALERLALYLERAQETREHIKSALIYPAVVTLTCLISLFILFGAVVPRFKPMFKQAGDALPGAAANLLAFSQLINEWWWAIMLVPLITVLVFMRHLRNPTARVNWERRLYAAPVVGELAAKAESAHICRALGSMLRNGVALPAAIGLTRDVTRSRVFADALDTVANEVRAGRGFAEPMRRTDVFPALVSHMLRVGEETGRQDEMLLKLADILETDTKRAIDRALALLTPAITIALGLVVAGVIMVILTAMLSVYDITM
ncbi:type II secretion system F family protein [Indioceanicola profundi]|uniref:type II secretion system F family protein n=1 Tax=Indioceanicola profundi TaxID=2220096 RepID=UPI000E6AC73A|nr:type II secretion system F family protein [Indioceanicola profundi]